MLRCAAKPADQRAQRRADLEQLHQEFGPQFADQRLDHRGMGERLRVRDHVAAAVPGFDQTHLLQPGQTLPQRRAVDTELFGQFPLGRQGRARRKCAVEDGVGDRRGDLLVDALAIGRTQRT